MIVVNPLNVENIIKVMPRYYEVITQSIDSYNEATSSLVVQITNEDTRQDLNHNISGLCFKYGKMTFKTDATFRDNTTYRLKIRDSNGLVIFRGKIFATKQNKQNYLING